MLIKLISKDIKYLLKNITLYLFFIVVILFYNSQFYGDIGDIQRPIKPVPGQNYYGSVIITDRTEEIKEVFRNLNRDLDNGTFEVNGFINKMVKINDDERDLLKEATNRIGFYDIDTKEINIKASYEEYLKIVREVDKKLGKNTSYGDKYRKITLNRNMTYEEAVTEFNDVLNKDKLTSAYARLFADYMGITAAFFPIFLSAFILTRDKRSKMHELIYSRNIKSSIYVISKYIALVASTLLVYLALATHATIKFSIFAAQNKYIIDYLAFYKYTIIWILPTLMFTIAFGMFISLILDNGILALPIQFVLWITSLMPLKGDYNLGKILIRFNTVGSYNKYILWSKDIITNRIFYAVLSIGIVFITALLLSYKRGGGFGVFTKSKKDNVLQHQNNM